MKVISAPRMKWENFQVDCRVDDCRAKLEVDSESDIRCRYHPGYSDFRESTPESWTFFVNCAVCGAEVTVFDAKLPYPLIRRLKQENKR